MWESRYSAEHCVYGTSPNDFMVDLIADAPPGRALCLADGEGRNGVYLASLGHTVTSVDLTAAGLSKAARLATKKGVDLTTVVADLAEYDLGSGQWDLIVSIFAHTPPAIRARVHNSTATALADGGLFVLEAYTPDQIGTGTGGPPTPELTMSLDEVQRELTGMEIVSGLETVRPVIEGPGHTGDGAVVQVVAKKRNGL